MRFPWKKRPESAGARARKQAETHLEEVRDQWPEVNRVASSLRELRRRNGFGEQIAHIFQGDDR